MITDDMLRNSATKATNALLSTLPDNYEHKFSRRFKRKMRKLIRHTNHAVLYKVLKNAACFIIVSLLAAIMFFTSHVKARESFFNWLTEQCKTFMSYYFDGLIDNNDVNNAEMPEYRLGWVPKGYVEDGVFVNKNTTIIHYSNSDKDSIILSYNDEPLTSALAFYDNTLYEHYSAIINNNVQCDIYIANNSTESNIIIISHNNILFQIAAFVDKDTLIRIVENIAIIQKK